jgi:N-methylhydantoinase A
VWVGGGFADVPVRARASCPVGISLDGPYILTEPQCSLLVPPGWRATVDTDGAVLLEVSA